MQCQLLSNQITKQDEEIMDSPMQIKLINFLGLKNYLMDKLVFKRKPSSYLIRKLSGKNRLFVPHQYKPPVRYRLEVGILEKDKFSIPYTKLIPINTKNVYFDTIVYAHGNSSDMYDGVRFMEKMALIYEAQYVIFDYNGYGQSKNSQVGQQIICSNIEIVLAWLNKPLNQIILWGFSLGTYPVVYAASKYFVKGIILQCPIASVGCFFQQNLTNQIKFKQDYFSNIDLITKVKGKIFIIHSSADEIIPISHAQLLLNKYSAANGLQNIYFIEVMKLSHNGIHKYLVSQKGNDLQKQLLSYLKQLKNDQQLGLQQVDERLFGLSQKINLANIKDQQFVQDSYELVQDSKGNFGVKQRNKKASCFCFSQQSTLSTRQKFRQK